MGNDLRAALCFIAFAGLCVATLALVDVFWDWNINPLKLAADIVQGVATVAAIVIGGVFAWRNLWWFRTFHPHITITHSVSHRPVGTQYIHLAVVAILYNSSRVKVEIREGKFRLAQVSPIDDEQLLSMYRMAFSPDGPDDAGEVRHIPWPLLDEVLCATVTAALLIEPGETPLETAEFIISSRVQSGLLYSYFYNPQPTASNDVATDWAATTPYDIVSRSDQ